MEHICLAHPPGYLNRWYVPVQVKLKFIRCLEARTNRFSVANKVLQTRPQVGVCILEAPVVIEQEEHADSSRRRTLWC